MTKLKNILEGIAFNISQNHSEERYLTAFYHQSRARCLDCNLERSSHSSRVYRIRHPREAGA